MSICTNNELHRCPCRILHGRIYLFYICPYYRFDIITLGASTKSEHWAKIGKIPQKKRQQYLKISELTKLTTDFKTTGAKQYTQRHEWLHQIKEGQRTVLNPCYRNQIAFLWKSLFTSHSLSLFSTYDLLHKLYDNSINTMRRNILHSPFYFSCSGVSSFSCLVCVPAGGCSPGLKAVGGGDCSCRAPGLGRWGPWHAFSCAGALPGCLCTPVVSVSCSSREERA